MRWLRLVLFLALIACLAPAISMAIAASIASWNGCSLNETSIQTCIINGQDYGKTLTTMAMMGWFLMTTLPAAVCVAALWIVIELARWLRIRQARRRAPPASV